MSATVKNILAIVLGVIVGMIVNMGIVMFSSTIIPPPEGVDNTTMEGLKAGMHLFEAKHYIMPFLAHALGTFTGAYTVVKLATSHHLKFAIGIAVFFLLGGIANVFMLPSPMWFTALDLGLAYIPMGIIAHKLAK